MTGAATGPGLGAAALRYVALGDSYTIGTALADAADRWPDRLVVAIGGEPPALELVANLGVNGYTSHDLDRPRAAAGRTRSGRSSRAS